MNVPAPEPARHRAVELAAAAWIVREERGLTAVEQDELSQWLAASPTHRAAFAERRQVWREFDRLAGLPEVLASAPDPDLLAPPRRRSPGVRVLFYSTLALAAAAACTVFLFRLAPGDPPAATRSPVLSTALAAPCETRTLADGSVVELNRGARLTVQYSPEARRVRLERGEAHFAITPDAARPFVVEVAGVTVRAVGTAFNVRLDAESVDVVVTEGTVAVTPPGLTGAAPSPPLLGAGQQVAIPIVEVAASPPVATLSATELAGRLAWQPRQIDFSDLPLSEAVERLNRHNPVQLVLGAPLLRSRRVNASIRSDNVEGFVRLMATALDLRAEWRSETEIVLYPAR